MINNIQWIIDTRWSVTVLITLVSIFYFFSELENSTHLLDELDCQLKSAERALGLFKADIAEQNRSILKLKVRQWCLAILLERLLVSFKSVDRLLVSNVWAWRSELNTLWTIFPNIFPLFQPITRRRTDQCKDLCFVPSSMNPWILTQLDA